MKVRFIYPCCFQYLEQFKSTFDFLLGATFPRQYVRMSQASNPYFFNIHVFLNLNSLFIIIIVISLISLGNLRVFFVIIFRFDKNTSTDCYELRQYISEYGNFLDLVWCVYSCFHFVCFDVGIVMYVYLLCVYVYAHSLFLGTNYKWFFYILINTLSRKWVNLVFLTLLLKQSIVFLPDS